MCNRQSTGCDIREQRVIQCCTRQVQPTVEQQATNRCVPMLAGRGVKRRCQSGDWRSRGSHNAFSISIAERDVDPDHEEVEDVQPDDRIERIKRLMSRAAEVADEDEPEEEEAFPFARLGAIELRDGGGPRGPEADEHARLERAGVSDRLPEFGECGHRIIRMRFVEKRNNSVCEPLRSVSRCSFIEAGS